MLYSFSFLSVFPLCLLIFPLPNALSQTPGDVNSDGFTNHDDLLLVKDHLLGRVSLQGDSLISADANQDEKIDVADMLTIDINTTTFSIPLVYVPSGTFTMGARDDGDDGTYRYSDELPRHEVTLSAYYIGKYEITNEQYCEVLNWAKGMGYLENSGGGSYTGGNVYKNGYILLYVDSYCQIVYSDGSFTWKYRDGYSMENHPVVVVSWYGSVAFCNWLSEKEGKTPAYNLSTWELVNKNGGGYRLPTEAEWERAAAWDGSKHWIYGYTSDNGNNRNRYNHYDDLGGTGYVNPLGLSDYPYTSPVGWFNGVNISPNGSVQTINSPSPVGCYDMSGNVWEWCHDWYSSTYYNGGAMIDPNGPASGSYLVLRGGGWDYSAQSCRSADRSDYDPTYADYDIGFRVALRSPAR